MADSASCKFECNALAIKDSELVSWNVEDLEKLFQEDRKMGFSIYKRIASTMADRLKDKFAQITTSFVPRSSQ